MNLHFRVDLDKTYLITPFEEKWKLLWIPFEPSEEKRSFPGMGALLRGAKEQKDRSGKVVLSILSASPSFMKGSLRRRLILDKVPYDHLILKPVWYYLRKGKFHELTDPFLYKLTHLLQLGERVGYDDREILIGDDWDLDPFIYTLYAYLRWGKVPREIYEEVLLFLGEEMDPAILHESLKKLPSIPPGGIYIRREKGKDPSFYRSFGPFLFSYEDTFQLAVLLFDHGFIPREVVIEVIREMERKRWERASFTLSYETLRHWESLRKEEEIRDLLNQMGLLRDLPPRLSLFPPIPRRSEEPPWEKISVFLKRRQLYLSIP